MTEPVLTEKSRRYARKVERRSQINSLTPEQFVTDPAYVEKDIWELKYASTSDEDDNDDEESSSEEEDEEGEEESEEEQEEDKSDTEEQKSKPAPAKKEPEEA